METIVKSKLPQFDRDRHGSLYDRGSADSYYRRERDPHYYLGKTYFSTKITDLTQEEVDEYEAGYDDNENMNNHKYYD